MLGQPGRAVALVAGLLMLAQVQTGAAQTTQEKLEDAEKKVEQIKKELSGIRSRRDALQTEIDSLTKQIAQAYAQMQALRGQIEETTGTIEQKGNRIRNLQGRLDDRARAAYIQGPAVLMEFVLEADSLTDLSDRVTFLSALNETDSGVATGLEVEREELSRFEDDLQGYVEQQEELLEQLEEQEAQLKAKWEEQQDLSEQAEEKLAEAEDVVAELKKKRREEILAALAAAEAARAPTIGGGAPAPVTGNGLLKVCPVDAPRSYINDFGFPRSGGRTHQGNDIFAPAGTPIRAAFDGVARESWNSLGGNSVFVTRSDGTYVYNAHLSAYAGVNGRQVKAGEVIGYVGNTGNAVGTPPHNHFEIHPGGGSAVNPYGYLNLVCGHNGSG
jgi:peptidoglycan LD-endopeptidase LytH